MHVDLGTRLFLQLLLSFQLLGRTPPHVELPGSEDEESEGEHEHGNEPEVDVTVPETEGKRSNSMRKAIKGGKKLPY